MLGENLGIIKLCPFEMHTVNLTFPSLMGFFSFWDTGSLEGGHWYPESRFLGLGKQSSVDLVISTQESLRPTQLLGNELLFAPLDQMCNSYAATSRSVGSLPHLFCSSSAGRQPLFPEPQLTPDIH